MKAILTMSLGFLLLGGPASAQCREPELVKDADSYNALVCNAATASQRGDNKKALGLYLAASKEATFESPNALLFGDIALTYAKLGKFADADKYLEYDNITVLWAIGIVRCEESQSGFEDRLLKDGREMKSEAARRMAEVLCGPIFDNVFDFSTSDAGSLVPAAKLILRHDAIRKEIEQLRRKHLQAQ
jgi:hypothetical protein